MHYCALMISLANSSQYQSIEAKLKFSFRTGGYEDIVSIFQLALILPLDNACCDKPLFGLMILAMYGKTHNFDFAKFGVGYIVIETKS